MRVKSSVSDLVRRHPADRIQSPSSSYIRRSNIAAALFVMEGEGSQKRRSGRRVVLNSRNALAGGQHRVLEGGATGLDQAVGCTKIHGNPLQHGVLLDTVGGGDGSTQVRGSCTGSPLLWAAMQIEGTTQQIDGRHGVSCLALPPNLNSSAANLVGNSAC